MKVLKLKPTIDEWGRSLTAKGLADGFCSRWKNYPEDVIQNIAFITGGRAPTLHYIKHNSYIGSLFQTAHEELKSAVKKSESEPELLPVPWTSRFGYIWLFKGCIYHVQYSDEEHSERKRFERLKQLYKDDGSGQPSNHRESIPERVRIEVWRRDGGKCARCGSREKLEYDHIVPVSKGGSNTARNIELLCESCNRKKSNHIG
jgi:hypothetical protein